MFKISSSNTFSVVVVYKPNFYHLNKSIQQQEKNFKKIILVNNSPDLDLTSFKNKKVNIINNIENFGLARALNIGIKEAKKNNAKFVALFDQDTIIDDEFSKKMFLYINKYKSIIKPSLFSPVFFNCVTQQFNKHKRLNFLFLKKISTDLTTYSFPDYTITSGSVIPISVLSNVGLMDENLFIDLIDTEWCYRAKSKGFDCVTINKVTINQYLGDYSVKFLKFSKPVHSPIRMYYFFRNSIYLYKSKHLSLNWCVVDFFRNTLRFLFYMLFVNKRSIYLKYIIKGYYHGLIKKMGKLEE